MKKFIFLSNLISIPTFNTPIRDKYQLINLLLQTLEYILSGASFLPQPKGIELFRISINVDKMSRIFYISENNKRIFSFNFPFKIVASDSKSTVDVYSYNHLDCLTQKDILGLKEILNLVSCPIKIQNMTLDNIFDFYTDDLYSEYNLNRVFSLFHELMIFEPGYIRYDYDLDNADEEYHPLFHLDLYYTNSNTFKLGLHAEKDVEDLTKMMDIKKRCIYLLEDNFN